MSFYFLIIVLWACGHHRTEKCKHFAIKSLKFHSNLDCISTFHFLFKVCTFTYVFHLRPSHSLLNKVHTRVILVLQRQGVGYRILDKYICKICQGFSKDHVLHLIVNYLGIRTEG